ncbi:hypothetical protein [Sorangium sp. So ce1389]|uniref:hypothetical protein n=1 Tax=Sorangium sp. So ce1389 TaxID=3133336 RepID=UPI003F62ADF6
MNYHGFASVLRLGRPIDVSAEHALQFRWSRLTVNCDRSIWRTSPGRRWDLCWIGGPKGGRIRTRSGIGPGVPSDLSAWQLSRYNFSITIDRPFVWSVDAGASIVMPDDHSLGITLQELTTSPDLCNAWHALRIICLHRTNWLRRNGDTGRIGFEISRVQNRTDGQLRID